MRGLAISMSLVLGCLLGGCSAMRVYYDVDPSADFSSYRSFDWMPEPAQGSGDPRLDGNEILHRRILDTVEAELTRKGYVRDTSGAADFLVGHHLSLDRVVNAQSLNNHYGYRAGWGWSTGPRSAPGYWSTTAQTHVDAYEEGTLIIDVSERGTRRLLWRGAATDEVHLEAPPDPEAKQLKEAVTKILANFPSVPGSEETSPGAT